jgi:hypothetical protein
MDKSYRQRFPVKFLSYFGNAGVHIPKVELYFSDNQKPMITRFPMGSDFGHVTYYITPGLAKDGAKEAEVM